MKTPQTRIISSLSKIETKSSQQYKSDDLVSIFEREEIILVCGVFIRLPMEKTSFGTWFPPIQTGRAHPHRDNISHPSSTIPATSNVDKKANEDMHRREPLYCCDDLVSIFEREEIILVCGVFIRLPMEKTSFGT
jgi:hypothetical protein